MTYLERHGPLLALIRRQAKRITELKQANSDLLDERVELRRLVIDEGRSATYAGLRLEAMTLYARACVSALHDNHIPLPEMEDVA